MSSGLAFASLSKAHRTASMCAKSPTSPGPTSAHAAAKRLYVSASASVLCLVSWRSSLVVVGGGGGGYRRSAEYSVRLVEYSW